MKEIRPISTDPFLALVETDGAPAKGAGLARRVRQLILEGALAPGTRLPASRALARQLGCARGTVEAAYGDLDAEGLIERRQGRGSFVAAALDRLARPARKDSGAPAHPAVLSERGRALAAMPRCPYPERARSFSSGVPDARLFPWDDWRRLTARRLQDGCRDLSGYTPPQGLEALRQALARWLRLTRGIARGPDQVLVLHSAQQALTLAASLLFDAGDPIALEDPGYAGAVAALGAAGLALVPCPVDGDGLETGAVSGRGDLAGVYVTPSYQNPLGPTLSLARRLDLIAWAGRRGAWIIEDDYAGGLTYDEKPIAALAGLDAGGRSLYIGSCSKLVFPGLRLAWLVLPPGLAESFTTLRANADGHCAALPQAVLADFIDQGLMARHVRRMAPIYRRRRDALVDRLEALNRALGAQVLQVRVPNAGLKLVVELAAPLDDVAIAQDARREDLELPTLSTTALDPRNRRQGFILGFSGLNEAEIAARAGRLGRVLARALSRAGKPIGS